jgi:hypothetical protein
VLALERAILVCGYAAEFPPGKNAVLRRRDHSEDGSCREDSVAALGVNCARKLTAFGGGRVSASGRGVRALGVGLC